MGWYHAEQLLKQKCPSAVLKHIVEPWFFGAGTCVLDCFMILVALVDCSENRNRCRSDFLLIPPSYIDMSILTTSSFNCHSTIRIDGSRWTRIYGIQERVAKDHGVEFLMSLSELPPNTEQKPRLALISGRTADNPKLLRPSNTGVPAFIWKSPALPPSPNWNRCATWPAPNVPVGMGYHKNVCNFVSIARN